MTGSGRERQSSESSPEALLERGLKELSLGFTTEQIRAFMTYLFELKKWSRAYNLTSLKTDQEIIVKHFLDSLLYLGTIPEGEVSILDVGSGAGFPGIPIKIMRPEAVMYLLESSRKKAAFLSHMIKVLRLEKIEVKEKRIEELKDLTVDVALTRALFDAGEFLKKASPHLKEGGRLVLSKGPKVREELRALTGVDVEVLTLPLPLSHVTRYLVVIRKDSNPGVSDEERSKTVHIDSPKTPCICVNAECRLRKAGCRGFEGCPGFRARG